MRKGFFAICSILLVLVVSIAVLVSSCASAAKCTIEVKATFDGFPWTGAVNYMLIGPTSNATGTSVSTNFTVACGNWTCAYVSGGPGVFVNIIESATQEVSAGSPTTFILNFVTPAQVDASVEFKTWTINGVAVDPGGHSVYPGDWIDIEYTEHVSGPGEALVKVHQTSWLQVHNIGWYGEESGPPIILHVVNAAGAVKMNPSADKSNQQATEDGSPVSPCDEILLPYCVPVNLDVEVDWELVVCNNYTKTINWIGFPSSPNILFEVTNPYDGLTFSLTSYACVEVGLGFNDTNPDNDCTTWCPALNVTYVLP
jgi:hypothetical protein